MIAEARKCVCGLDMVESKGVYVCINWDGIQEIETRVNPVTGMNYERVKTPWDDAHERDFRKKLEEWYPDQPRK